MKAKGYGRIVNIASGAIAGGAGVAAYAASKGGIFSLTRSLASEGAPHGFWASHRATATDVRRGRCHPRENDGGPGGPGVHSGPRRGMHPAGA